MNHRIFSNEILKRNNKEKKKTEGMILIYIFKMKIK